jgi:ADP-heptose:LPS heptosyltransferase
MPRTTIIDTRYGRAVGIGDVVMWCWIAEGAKGSDHELRLYCEGGKHELLELLGQQPAHHIEGAQFGCEGFLRDLEVGKEQDRIKTWSEAFGFTSEPKRPPYRIRPESFHWADEIVRPRRAEGRKVVLLFPQTTQRPREWRAEWWIDLVWKLQNNGFAPIVLMSHEDGRFTNCPAYWYGHCWNDVAALMLRSELVVGPDSAPAHLSGTLGVPTMALLGPTTPKVFSHIPEVQVVTSQFHCTGCNFGCPFNSNCDVQCDSLYALSPDTVFERIRRRLGC